MNSCYKTGLGTLILAIAAGLSGGLAALLYHVNDFLFVSHWLALPKTWEGILQTHARMMVFFTLQPALTVAFGTWFIPVLIGARNFSFPLINVLSLVFLSIGFCCNLFTFLDPQASLFIMTSLGCWAIASILFSINMLVTVLNNRASGVGFLSLPVFVWMQGISAVILLGTASVLLAALTRDYWDGGLSLNGNIEQTVRNFSYPMVMVMVLPAFGIIFHVFHNMAETLNSPDKKNVIWIAFSVFILFLFWNKAVFEHGFWGLNSYANVKMAFVIGLYGMVVGLSVYALKVLLSGKRSMPVPVLWSLGSIFLFVFAWPYVGLMSVMQTIHSGITYSVLFTVFAGFYFWMGKIFGRHYTEYLGKLHFGITLAGVLLTLNILPVGRDTAFIGDVFMGVSMLVFIGVMVSAYCHRNSLAANYWGNKTMTGEWKIPSPMYLMK